MKKLSLLLLLVCVSCRAVPGPDKSIAGMVLGAGWGAGMGGAIGNQVNHTPQGIAIGSGFGAVSGLIQGIGLDQAEGVDLQHQRDLEELRLMVASNEQSLISVQETLDNREQQLSIAAAGAQVFFDADQAELRSGSSQQLERLSNAIKNNPFFGRVEVHGHSDTSEVSGQAVRVAEARAKTVATFLANQGISLDQIRVLNHGAKRPLGSNNSETGRQLNRRVEVVLLK